MIIDGGVVEGQQARDRRSRHRLPASHAARSRSSTWESVKLVIGWFALLTIIGLGVMVFAEAISTAS